MADGTPDAALRRVLNFTPNTQNSTTSSFKHKGDNEYSTKVNQRGNAKFNNININNNRKERTIKPNIRLSDKQRMRQYKTYIAPKTRDRKIHEEDDSLVAKIREAFGIKHPKEETNISANVQVFDNPTYTSPQEAIIPDTNVGIGGVKPRPQRRPRERDLITFNEIDDISSHEREMLLNQVMKPEGSISAIRQFYKNMNDEKLLIEQYKNFDAWNDIEPLNLDGTPIKVPEHLEGSFYGLTPEEKRLHDEYFYTQFDDIFDVSSATPKQIATRQRTLKMREAQVNAEQAGAIAEARGAANVIDVIEDTEHEIKGVAKAGRPKGSQDTKPRTRRTQEQIENAVTEMEKKRTDRLEKALQEKEADRRERRETMALAAQKRAEKKIH